jgi:hypothetical protein
MSARPRKCGAKFGVYQAEQEQGDPPNHEIQPAGPAMEVTRPEANSQHEPRIAPTPTGVMSKSDICFLNLPCP